MSRSPVLTAALAGAALAIIALAGVGAFLLLGGARDLQAGTKPALVATVLIGPSAEVSQAPIVIGVIAPDGAVASLDPSATTSTGTTWDDTFSFGGGAGLAKAISAANGGAPVAWIVAPFDSWRSVVSTSVPVDEPVDAFIGGELISVPAGEQVKLDGPRVAALLAARGMTRPADASATQSRIAVEVLTQLVRSGALASIAHNSGSTSLSERGIAALQALAGSSPSTSAP
jgi:hypothetical protein